MTQRVAFYVLILVVCSSVAAKPINKKPAKTAAVHPPAAPKQTNTTLAGPANVLFGSAASPPLVRSKSRN